MLGLTYSYTTASGYPVVVGYINSFYDLVVFLPYLAVVVRRLHDVNKSGKLLLLILIPLLLIILAGISGIFVLVGIMVLVALALSIWIIVLQCTKGTDGPNKYGEDPLGGGFKFSFEEEGDTPNTPAE